MVSVPISTWAWNLSALTTFCAKQKVILLISNPEYKGQLWTFLEN